MAVKQTPKLPFTTEPQQRETLGLSRGRFGQRLQQRMGRLTTRFLHQNGLEGAGEVMACG